MDTSEALQTIRALSNGRHPVSGAALPDDALFQHPQTIRALFSAVAALEEREQKERRRRALPRNAGKAWDELEDERLSKAFESGLSVKMLASEHGRSAMAVRLRLVKLGLMEDPEAVSFQDNGSH